MYDEVLDRIGLRGRTDCRRKLVGCSIGLELAHSYLELVFANNGPTRGHECSNEVGNCGCCHAEVRAIMKLIGLPVERRLTVLVANYSPCTACAHAIIASGRINKVVRRHLTEHDTRGEALLIKAGIRVEVA